MTPLPIPTEDIEQRAVVQYCRARGLPCFRVPNETFTKSWAQKNKNKALGVSAGVCDLFVVIEGVGLLGIEMKRTRGSVTSPEQKEWIRLLNTCPGVQAQVCKGADIAIEFIESFLPHKQNNSQTADMF